MKWKCGVSNNIYCQPTIIDIDFIFKRLVTTAFRFSRLGHPFVLIMTSNVYTRKGKT